MDINSKIFIAGKDGVAGSAILRLLKRDGFQNLLTPSCSELNFCDQVAVDHYFKQWSPDYVFYAAAKMGGIIYRNTHPADILYENLMMQANIIRAAHENGAKKLLFMSSDFIYPNIEERNLCEKDFLTAPFGTKDLPYTLAKTTGIKMCDYYHKQYGDDFFSVVPCAFFGYNASFDLERANVVGALIKRFHDAKREEAKELFLWGSGKPKKEFLFCDDVADACIFLMKQNEYHLLTNIGSGDGGITIFELAKIIKKIVGFRGDITCDLSKPDGIMCRVMDSSQLYSMGWKPKFSLEQALNLTYQHFLTMQYPN